MQTLLLLASLISSSNRFREYLEGPVYGNGRVVSYELLYVDYFFLGTFYLWRGATLHVFSRMVSRRVAGEI